MVHISHIYQSVRYLFSAPLNMANRLCVHGACPPPRTQRRLRTREVGAVFPCPPAATWIAWRILVVALIGVSLSGCMATGAKFSAPLAVQPDKSVLYFYRPGAFQQGGIYPDIYVNGAKVGVLKNGGFLVTMATPGPMTLLIKEGRSFSWVYAPQRFQFDIQPGQQHFYRLSMEMYGIGTIKMDYSLFEVESTIALKEIANLHASTE